MPSVKPYQIIRFDGFPGGLNSESSPSNLELTELLDATNVRINSRGRISMRSGYQKFATMNSHTPRKLLAWTNPNNGDKELFSIEENALSDTKGIFVTDIATTTSVELTETLTCDIFEESTYGFGMAAAGKKMYFSTKESAAVAWYDGLTPSGTTTDIPSAKILRYHHDRLFAFNTTDNPARLFFSNLLEPEKFDPADGGGFIDVDPDDGEEINCVVVFGDDLVIFKKSSIWKMTGRTPDSFALYRVDNLRGTVGPESAAQLRGVLIFLDPYTGVWSFDGAVLELISERINSDLIKDNVRDTLRYPWQVIAYSGEDRFYLGVTYLDNNPSFPNYYWTTWVFHGDTKGWAEFTDDLVAATTFEGIRYRNMDADLGIFIPDYSTNDNGALNGNDDLFNATVKTPWVLLGSGSKSRVRRIEMTVNGEVGSTFRVRMWRDFTHLTFGDVYVERTYTIEPPIDGSLLTESEMRITMDGWGNRVHAVCFEFYTDMYPFEIVGMAVLFTSQTDVRGKRQVV